MNKQVGNFNIDVWDKGSPIWIIVTYEGSEFKFISEELDDLLYALQKTKEIISEKELWNNK